MKKTDSIKLNLLGLPVIQTISDFSKITHISKYTIYQLSYNADKHYKTYPIKKKSGKPRIINQPSRKLKALQSWILVNILNELKVSSSCKGFEKGSSTVDNVEPHKGANTILTIDLKDFFPSIKRNQVYTIFKIAGYNKTISTILTNICTYNGILPQGSPCSPKLANLVAWSLDLRIQGYVGKRGINFTRYADDLSFSGLSPGKIVKIIPMIKTIIEDEKFNINKKKTRVAGAARAKKITGLIISNDTYGIGKQKYLELRSKIYHLTMPSEQTNNNLLNEVSGWLSYLNSVDKTRLVKAHKYIEHLEKKYPTTLVSKLK
ncbi:MAG: retron St85 family RNA-directed DNA polymerase [Bacteroidales bacterium]|jgi:retron-type reverse transcriptase|nr:retron St85 family RNA-directed DNA polymerase [Bacteroidales bacterium]